MVSIQEAKKVSNIFVAQIFLKLLAIIFDTFLIDHTVLLFFRFDLFTIDKTVILPRIAEENKVILIVIESCQVMHW